MLPFYYLLFICPILLFVCSFCWVQRCSLTAQSPQHILTHSIGSKKPNNPDLSLFCSLLPIHQTWLQHPIPFLWTLPGLQNDPKQKSWAEPGRSRPGTTGVLSVVLETKGLSTQIPLKKWQTSIMAAWRGGQRMESLQEGSNSCSFIYWVLGYALCPVPSTELGIIQARQHWIFTAWAVSKACLGSCIVQQATVHDLTTLGSAGRKATLFHVRDKSNG